MTQDFIEELLNKRAQLQDALLYIGDMRPGSLVPRYRVCGKPNCHCAKEGSRGHGPSWSLTRAVAGKTVTKVIPAHAVEITKAQIAAYKHFRELIKNLVEVSEQLCDARLVQRDTTSQEEAKKGASQSSSLRKSSRKSSSS
jgi:hypothetical protein